MWANQDLELALHCVSAQYPISWATHLLWVEYALNILVSAATGMSHIETANGFQPPFFQETKVAVQSIQDHMQRCRRIWEMACTALFLSTVQNQRLADRLCLPAPAYILGQKV